MHLLSFLYPTLLLLGTGPAEAASKPSNAVLLSQIQSLTLRNGLKTSHRRVSAIPQLKCIGGSGRGLYDIDVMRCKNSGSDYDEHNVQWTCSASLPPEFKLGSTDVICEGYNSPDDPYVLKGSCGVEYRLILTQQGEEKYGKRSGFWGSKGNDSPEPHHGTDGVSVLFWIIFIGVVLWMIYSAVNNRRTGAVGGLGARGTGGGGGGWGGFGGGGGGGLGGNGYDDPPPPYDYQAPRKPRSSGAGYGAGGSRSQQWRPGFWTGALGGAAATYAMGRNQRQRSQPSGNSGQSWWDSGEGSSSGGSSAPSSSRYESTGFGSSSRR